MKLKEAQMLGILALLAVVTVLLCMWGGDDVPDEGALISADEQALGSADAQRSVSDLLADLMADRQTPAPPEEPSAPESAVVIGGSQTPPPARVSEESALRTLIDRMPPTELPLVPREQVPSGSTPGPAPTRAEPPKPVYHVVQNGDTLSEISQKYYGTSRHHALIQKANASLVPDERLLRVGMKLRIPPLEGGEARQVASASAPTPALSTTAARRTYTVQKGDTFWRIAEKCYGSGGGLRCKDIQAANKSVASEPSKLQPGMVLVIP